jgi:hypothetical protein
MNQNQKWGVVYPGPFNTRTRLTFNHQAHAADTYHVSSRHKNSVTEAQKSVQYVILESFDWRGYPGVA